MDTNNIGGIKIKSLSFRDYAHSKQDDGCNVTEKDYIRFLSKNYPSQFERMKVTHM